VRTFADIVTAGHTDVRSTVYCAVCRAELALDDVVEYRLEVVEEDGIGGAFEHESETPVWVDATAGRYTGGGNSSISEEESDGEELDVQLARDRKMLRRL
jgi:hypothetical protein